MVKSRRVLLCSLSGTFGGVELRMALEARLLLRAGYIPAVAINLHPPLLEWADALSRDNIPVYDFDPPPLLESWLWMRRNKMLEAKLISKFVYPLWRVARAKNRLKAKYSSARFLRRLEPDLLHVFLPWTDFGGTRLWIANFCRIPTVISVRNAFRFRGNSLDNWGTRHYRQAFRSVRGVYAISDSALTHFLDVFGEFIFPGTVFEVIHNSVDTERFRPNPKMRVATREALGLPQEALVLGSVMRLDKQKRPEALVFLFAELKQAFPNLYLVLTGSGSLEQDLRRQVETLGIANSVVFTGWHPRVENVLPAFDVFVLLSGNEGFGTVTVEAMACGLPVVGTDVPGTQDIISNGKNGVLVPLENPRAATDACTRLLTNRGLRTQFGRAAREETVFQYDQRIWERRVLAFYEKVLHISQNARANIKRDHTQ